MKWTNIGREQADAYHVASSNRSLDSKSGVLDDASSEALVELLATQPQRPSRSDAIALGSGQPIGNVSLETAIETRYSGRDWTSQPIARSQLARLLYLANGLRANDRHEHAYPARNAPSAGALGSVEIYCCVLNVADVAPGLYCYDPVSYELLPVKHGSFDGWLRHQAMLQPEFGDCAAVLFLVSLQDRLATKYGQRAYRLGLLDAGHVSQNVYLAATAMQLEVCAAAGFIDDEVNRALQVNGLDRCAILAIGVGMRR